MIQNQRRIQETDIQTSLLGQFKLNAIGSNCVGLGAVIRDDVGQVLACLAKKLDGSFSPFIAECLAPREGLLLAKQAGIPIIFTKLMRESGSSYLFRAFIG
ncbi:hypothetical protein L484_012832 [Morus notabilis]|uniref:RNase H type-1 domain-containing protein n=1 Tax=Morus notabilis TaxID=981085 RepID=W9QV05_9ROSA|nr:hypothetical protein L484_012832 [Morus notabilis]